MKLHALNAGGLNIFTGHGSNYVMVNQILYDSSLIVLPRQIIPWPVEHFDNLSATDFALFADLAVEVVLLGTGQTLRFPHPALTAELTRKRIGVEIMDNAAACRTYNILSGEGRIVAAALMLP